MHRFNSVNAMVKANRPEHPVYCLRPSAVTIASHWFLDNFPGRVLFAVKTNPDFVKLIADAGIQHFDVASLNEIRLVSHIAPQARMSFMHPVKSRESIRQAYYAFGIRDFSLDCEAELEKILEETGNAKDLNLFVRLSVSNRHSKHSLAGKFGVSGKTAGKLLFRARQKCQRLGICFHAGSQIMNPKAYRYAMLEASRVISQAGVIIDIMDVGGGFPSIYPGLEPPPLEEYIKIIFNTFQETLVSEACELWCEPGRALTAEGASLVTRVELRKDQALYLNDGTYGGLFDAGQCAMVYPVKRVESESESTPDTAEFIFYGPTCDSIDVMQGPFLLPADMREGDYIEIENMGAYSASLRSSFNGFTDIETVIVQSLPTVSMYTSSTKTVSKNKPDIDRRTKVQTEQQNTDGIPKKLSAIPLMQETNHDAS